MSHSKKLLSAIQAIQGPPPSSSQKMELVDALNDSFSSLLSLLSYPPPMTSGRKQIESKDVRLPNKPPILLDDQDVQITLKLSDDLHLNEISCVHLLDSAKQAFDLMGREPLEILRLATGLLYTERRDLLTALYTLLRVVVLVQGLESDIVFDIQKYLEKLINNGLRQRLISLIKELSREEPAGLGGPHSECYVIDSSGDLFVRQAVVSWERRILGHCLVLSFLVVRTSPKDVKDIFLVLKDSSSELSGTNDTIKRQVMAAGNDPNVEGFVGSVRLAWTVHLMITQDALSRRDIISSASSSDLGYLQSCLEVIFSKNVFQFILDEVLRTAAYENDDEDIRYMYNTYLHKMITYFLSHPLAIDKVKESKKRAMSMLSPYHQAGSHDSNQTLQVSETGPLPFVSLLEFVSRIYQKEPELLSGNYILWTFVKFAGEDHTNFQTLVAFLNMLSTLASSEEGASKVFELLEGKVFSSVAWSTLFDGLSIYAEKFRHSFETAGAMLPELPEGDAKVLVSYLNVLQKVVENGNPLERMNWFPDIEPLFKLFGYENVPPYLKDALRNAITALASVSPFPKGRDGSYLEQFPDSITLSGSAIQPCVTRPVMSQELQVFNFVWKSRAVPESVGQSSSPAPPPVPHAAPPVQEDIHSVVFWRYILIQIILCLLEVMMEAIPSYWTPNSDNSDNTVGGILIILGVYSAIAAMRLAYLIMGSGDDIVGCGALLIEVLLSFLSLVSMSFLRGWALRGFRFGIRFLLAVCYPILKKCFTPPEWLRSLPAGFGLPSIQFGLPSFPFGFSILFNYVVEYIEQYL